MIKKIILTILVLSTVNSTSYSQKETQKTIQKISLTKGVKAPFDGVLLSRPALAKIITDYEKDIKILQARLEKEKRDSQAKLEAVETICKIRIDGVKKVCKISEASHKKIYGICETALSRAQAPTPWYKSPSLNQALGCAVCGGLCVGITLGVATAKGQ